MEKMQKKLPRSVRCTVFYVLGSNVSKNVDFKLLAVSAKCAAFLQLIFHD